MADCAESIFLPHNASTKLGNPYPRPLATAGVLVRRSPLRKAEATRRAVPDVDVAQGSSVQRIAIPLGPLGDEVTFDEPDEGPPPGRAQRDAAARCRTA